MKKLPQSVSNLLNKYSRVLIKEVTIDMSKDEFVKQKTKQLERPIEGGSIGIVEFEDKIILTKRTKGPHSGWAMPGGRVELSENFEDGFIRECKEECGIETVISSLYSIENKTFRSPNNELLSFFLAVFVAKCFTKPYTTTEAKKEGLVVDLFYPEELPSNLIPTDRKKIDSYYNILKSI